jgi:hypothetical protein
VENYLRMIQALFCERSIRWLSHALHPRAPIAAIKVCASARPGLFEPRIGSTGADAQPWEPSKAARLIPTPGTF